MKILKIATTLAFAMAMSTSPALAGSTSMSGSDGKKLKIKCVSAGCTVRLKKPGEKWAVIEKGPGGRSNFKKLVAKYKTEGYSN